MFRQYPEKNITHHNTKRLQKLKNIKSMEEAFQKENMKKHKKEQNVHTTVEKLPSFWPEQTHTQSIRCQEKRKGKEKSHHPEEEYRLH